MNTFSFFFCPEKVYEISLKALKIKKFDVLAIDESKRIIFAKQKSTWIRPEIELQICIQAISAQQTKVEVNSIMKKKGMSIEVKSQAEQQFFQSLFNCFDHIAL